jgi:class 3 adenylate cyclase
LTRWEYAPVGPVPLLAERLRAAASPGQILISQRVDAAVADAAITSPAGDGAWDLLGLE